MGSCVTGLLRPRLPGRIARLLSDFPGREQHFPASATLCATVCSGLHHFLLVLSIAWLYLTLGWLKPDPAKTYLYSE